jgi:2-polyprenyl-3-methyl-5-hydroxy-6-metoxy-1,4-benzoquinol methylase
VIVAGDLLTHLEDLNGFLACCRKHLRHGGKVLVTTPNPWNWRLLMRSAATTKTCGNPEQTLWLCPQTLRQLAARHGWPSAMCATVRAN